MKKLLINAATGLISIIASPIITAWITGQPLTGLVKVRGFVPNLHPKLRAGMGIRPRILDCPVRSPIRLHAFA